MGVTARVAEAEPASPGPPQPASALRRAAWHGPLGMRTPLGWQKPGALDP